MNIQYSNKARLFSLIIGAIGLAISNQTQAACDYYKPVECPLTYECFGDTYDILEERVNYNQRWTCGSGYKDPTYARSRSCKYTFPLASAYRNSHCGPFEMEPLSIDNNRLKGPVICPSKPCVGKGEPLGIPDGSGWFKY